MKPSFELPPRGLGALRTAWVDFRPGVAAALGGIFVWAGALKLRDPVAFAGDIGNFHLVAWPLGMRMAFYLPWLEIVCGLALFLGWMRTGALAILTGLTTVFIGATVIARLRGIDVNCGCFGSVSKDLTFGWHLAIDFGILAGLLLVWYWHAAQTRRERVAAP